MVSKVGSFEQRLNRLVSSPPERNRPFVLGETGTDDLYHLHALLLCSMRRHLREGQSLLVTTRDRTRIAAAVLACLAGGNELVLPHACSSGVLEDLRDDFGLRFVLCDDAAAIPPGLEALPWKEGPAIGTDRPFSTRAAGDRLLRLFTGGSTGRPRMWEKTVYNLLGEAICLTRRFRIDSRDIILCAVTPYHIYGLLLSVLVPLVSGAAVVREAPQFHGEIEKTLREQKATVLVLAPAHYRALRGRQIPGHGLRLAFSSGGFLAEEDSTGFSAGTGIGVTEIYGSTETGGIACRNRAEGENAWTPFDCVRWKVAQERLCVQTPFLSPLLELDREGFFVTADRVVRESDTTFTLLGRMDGIVKVAGKRVALDEVEARIRALPGIRDAYVLSLSSDTMRENEIVCLVAAQASTPPEEDLRESLLAVLEPSAVPRRVRWVDEIPLTAAGKRDRRRAEELFEVPK